MTSETNTSDELPVPGMDEAAAKRWAQHRRLDSPWLHEEVARRMLQRLQWFRVKPESWLHWDPVAGGLLAHQSLLEALPQAVCRVWAHDTGRAIRATQEAPKFGWKPLSWRWRRAATAQDEGAPVAMVWANMALHQEPLPRKLFRAWHSALKVDGFVMFSCLGPDSLSELRLLYSQMGWTAPAHDFTDMHDWGDMLVASGFAEPVMDMERITLSFSSAEALLLELRGLGRNLNVARFGALRGHQWRADLCGAIEARLPRDAQGRLLLTFEVVYGHAFKPQPRLPMRAEQTVSVDDMRAMLKAARG